MSVMKIDLHCHTQQTKKGDGSERNVTPDIFRSKLELADIKIVAITNHNSFDIRQFNELREKVQDICQVWPGVEIDIKNTANKDTFHLIVVCNPDKVKEFDKCTKDLFNGKDINNIFYSLEQVCSEYKQCDVIYIPHFHNKRPAISENDRVQLLKLVGDPARVFTEPRDHRTLGVLSNNHFNSIIGSDVKDWSSYEKCTFADLRLPVGSFSEFLLLSRRDSSVVKTLLSQKPAISIIGKPHASVKLNLEIYPDINIIFGPKGTGKTEILKSLYDALIKEGRTCKKYIASERSEDFSTLLSSKDIDVALSEVNATSCSEEFQSLKSWSDSNPSSFMAYKNWITTKGNSNNKARMRITEAVHATSNVDVTYNMHKRDKESLTEVILKIKSIALEQYITERDKIHLLKLLSILKESIASKWKTDWIDKEATRLTNYSIDKIKMFADRNSDTVSRPSTAGLTAFVECRIKLFVIVRKILHSMCQPEKNERKLLGTLEDKGDIYINSKYRMLCNLSRAEEFNNNYGIRKLRKIQDLLRKISKKVFSEDVALLIDELNDLCTEDNITSVKPFLGISKQIITNDGLEYQPSNGEKGILLLQQALKEEADAYFLDEPELGMGNSYIDTDIKPLIQHLGKQSKYVIVVTHNANIAVRTLPYVSIYRTHENGIYKTYVGNPFDDKLINLTDPTDIRSWTEESLHSLEGGKEAFYDRKYIYESKDS